jgi:hypothetical protein
MSAHPETYIYSYCPLPPFLKPLHPEQPVRPKTLKARLLSASLATSSTVLNSNTFEHSLSESGSSIPYTLGTHHRHHGYPAALHP